MSHYLLIIITSLGISVVPIGSKNMCYQAKKTVTARYIAVRKIKPSNSSFGLLSITCERRF